MKRVRRSHELTKNQFRQIAGRQKYQLRIDLFVGGNRRPFFCRCGKRKECATWNLGEAEKDVERLRTEEEPSA